MSSKNVLLIASTASMIKQFNMRNIKLLQQLGYDVTVAANFRQPGTITKIISDKLIEELKHGKVHIVQMDFERGAGHINSNLNLVRQIRKLVKNKHYDFVHTQAALASVLVRAALIGTKIPVLYTAHGFQFSKQISLIRSIPFFILEFVMSFFTWGIITINDEDTVTVKKYFHEKHMFRINGVGVNLTKFSNNSRALSGSNGKIIKMITVGELSKRKNQSIVLRAMKELNIPNLHYVMVGIGAEHDKLVKLSEELGISENVHFINYSENVATMYADSDFAIYPSFLEGLLTSGVESLAMGLPLIGSNVRGIAELVSEDKNGFLINPYKIDSVVSKISKMVKLTADERIQMGDVSKKKAQQFDACMVDLEMKRIYQQIGNSKK